MPYEQVQFLGWSVNTAGNWNSTTGLSSYTGLSDEWHDARARVKLVGAVLEVAKVRANPDSKVLKVFMMPEFFFRGAAGGYDLGTVDVVVSSLQELVKEPSWKDWLFVFGSTIVTWDVSPEPPAKWSDDTIKSLVDAYKARLASQGVKDKPFTDAVTRYESLLKAGDLTDEVVKIWKDNQEAALTQTAFDTAERQKRLTAYEAQLKEQQKIREDLKAIRAKLAQTMNGPPLDSKYKEEVRSYYFNQMLEAEKQRLTKAGVSGMALTDRVDQYKRRLSLKQIQNFVLCQGGGQSTVKDPSGDSPATRAARVVVKENLSWVDFFYDPARLMPYRVNYGSWGLYWQDLSHLMPMDTPGRSEAQEKVQYGRLSGTSIFNYPDNTLKWGVEICLDHLERRLAVSSNRPELRIQLIPSCGMSIVDNAVVVKNGYVFNCDGAEVPVNPGAIENKDRSAHTELRVLDYAGNDMLKAERPSIPTRYLLTPVSDFTVTGKANKTATAETTVTVKQSDLLARGLGELHVYEAMTLYV